MIARSDYAGPITKSAEAMFARAERNGRRSNTNGADRAVGGARPISPIRQAIHELGLTMTMLRQWEDAGVIAFERAKGRRVVDEAALEHLRTVAQLRRAGFTIKQIGWISDTLPPSVPAMHRALQTRLEQLEIARARSIAAAIVSGKTHAASRAAKRLPPRQAGV